MAAGVRHARPLLGLLVLAAAAREDRLDACGDEGEGGAGGGGAPVVAAIGLALLLAVERTALAALDLRRQRGGGRPGPGRTTERRPI
ncbi:hypothetical protein ACH4EC_24615 [Streptomyces anulatus]